MENTYRNACGVKLPKVINCKKAELKKIGYDSFEEWLGSSKKNIYIGRNMTFYVPGTTHSKWANKFPVKKYGLEKCLEMYENYVRDTPELYDNLDELIGKTMACWCKPERCHGDILRKLIKEKYVE